MGDRTDAHRTLTDIVPSLTPADSDLGAAVVVSVVGELDLTEAPLLMELLDQQLTRPGLGLVVVDLSEVEFLGSSGLGVLANIATRAVPTPDRDHPGGEPGPQVRLVAPPTHRPVVHPWEMMNLQQIVPLHPDVAAALHP